ncbi:MAG TPA: ROK family protein [Candidatus Eisenbacteria bacterium]|nr:ROK family protein [Candidatus Eisenbacteria bacterium]
MRIGIDLGGTKIEGIALGPGGSPLAGRRVATPQNDYEGTLRAIVALVQELESSAGARGSIGIGHPGAVSKTTGLIKNANSTWLNDRPLERDLQETLGRPVRLANDANCFALSEATDGAGAGRSVVFGVIVGTGTGGGVVVHGRVLEGQNAVAGEWGHNPLPWPRDDERPGPDCYCGKRGCIETFLSGPGFARDHAAHTEATLAPAEILALAARGDPESGAALDRYLDRMARSLATVINLLDPNVIVLGGGMSHIEALYRFVPKRWSTYVFSDRVDTSLEPAIHGDASGVRGAAWLWPE